LTENNNWRLTPEEDERLRIEREEIAAAIKIGPIDEGHGDRDGDRKRKQKQDKQKQKQKSEDKDQHEQKKKQKKKGYFVQRHSEDGLLAEVVIVEGRTFFAVSRKNGDYEPRITLEESIEDKTGTKIFIPSQNPLSRQFRFKSREEFDQCMYEDAKTETHDSLFNKIRSIWAKYIDADDFHISLCAADTFFTYFQDKIGLTHYLFFVGGNDTGKSNNLTVLEYLGFRVYNSLGISAANIYTALGDGEDGQTIICEDEADNIEFNHEKMKIYKGGYQEGKKVPKTDLPHGKRVQNSWNTFGFKALAAEKLPDITKTRGFHQRIIPLYCRDGTPEYDIAEITTTGGEEEFQDLLDELDKTHNLLLAYKLLHYHEIIPDIKLRIRNREKQLFKPILRVFQNTETFKELLPVVSHYINQRRQSNYDTLEANVFRLVYGLISELRSYSLTSSQIWQEVKDALKGEAIPNKPLSYDTEQFGIVSQRQITAILIEQFGAKKTKTRDSIILTFNEDRLKGLTRKYKPAKVDDVDDVDDLSGMSLDQYTKQDKEISKTDHEIDNNSKNVSQNNQDSVTENDSKRLAHHNNPPHPPHPPQQKQNTNPNEQEDNAAKLREYDRLSARARKSKDASRITNPDPEPGQNQS
jgi:hypothetical protein